MKTKKVPRERNPFLMRNRNYNGNYGYDSLTHAKSILISPPDVAIDHLFPPYITEKVQSLNQWFEY
jgi:aldehyde dehydrogenase (NAD+)